jgi:hypothetical protein
VQVSTLVLAAIALAPLAVIGQSPLPVGTPANETASTSEPGRFSYRAAATGVLTVVVIGSEDLQLKFTDIDGQVFQMFFADGDMLGKAGTEIIAVPVTAAVDYIIEVHSYGAAPTRFKINASFMAEPALATAPDPDGRPSQAKQLVAGVMVRDSLHPDRDDEIDWYTYTATEPATLVFSSRVNDGEFGDITLEAYLDNDFGNYVAMADLGMRGTPGNESLVLEVAAGDVVHLRVWTFATQGPRVDYRLTLSLLE